MANFVAFSLPCRHTVVYTQQVTHQDRSRYLARTKAMHQVVAEQQAGQSIGSLSNVSACLRKPVFGVKPMLDPKLFDDLSRRVAGNLPPGLQGLQDDLQRNLRSAMESALTKLNLVSREEFEIQQAVLLRTREKLRALEARVAALEASTTDS